MAPYKESVIMHVHPSTPSHFEIAYSSAGDMKMKLSNLLECKSRGGAGCVAATRFLPPRIGAGMPMPSSARGAVAESGQQVSDGAAPAISKTKTRGESISPALRYGFELKESVFGSHNRDVVVVRVRGGVPGVPHLQRRSAALHQEARRPQTGAEGDTRFHHFTELQRSKL